MTARWVCSGGVKRRGGSQCKCRLTAPSSCRSLQLSHCCSQSDRVKSAEMEIHHWPVWGTQTEGCSPTILRISSKYSDFI